MKIGLIPSAVVATAQTVTLHACGGNDDTTAGDAPSASAPGNTNTATAADPAGGASNLLDETELAEIVGGPVNHVDNEASCLEGQGCTRNRKAPKSGAGAGGHRRGRPAAKVKPGQRSPARASTELRTDVTAHFLEGPCR